MEELRVCVSISETPRTHPFRSLKLLFSLLNKPEVIGKWHSAPLKLRSGPRADPGRVAIRSWHSFFPFFTKADNPGFFFCLALSSRIVSATGIAVDLRAGKKQAWKQRITAC